MKALRFALIGLVLVAVLGRRLWRRRAAVTRTPRVPREDRRDWVTSDVALVMSRELRERVRSRFYLIGTVFILVVVGAAIVIPVLNKSSAPTERIGVIGPLSPSTRSWITAAATANGATARFVTEANVAGATTAVTTGHLDFAIDHTARIIVKTQLASSDFSATASLVRAVAVRLGDDNALAAAHLTSSQAQTLAGAKPLPIVGLHRGSSAHVNATSLIGVILIFIMLSQYNTWILIGVMEEKSSRVIEVLLAAVRPVKLLSGKVLGIGVAALLQASLTVVFALALSKAVGSNLLHGTGPAEVVSTLVWLVLGYALYSWIYAAAGSMAERQDQVQSLALPLSIPLIVGYVVTLTSASAASPSLLLKIFAYLPLTAPFAMTAMVGFGDVTWWQFMASVVISLASTWFVARVATSVYRRAILRTGSRVRLREFRKVR